MDWQYRYRTDDAPDPADTATVDRIVAMIRRDVLPQTPLRGLSIGYVKGLKHLGKFVSGTATNPVVLLCMGTIKRSCKQYGVTLQDGILSTILHELGHAIQEKTGRPLNEDEAERFAHEYWRTGNIRNFWDKPSR